MKIAIGSDHAGFRYKEAIKELLQSLQHEVTDFGTHSEEPVDYPLFIRPVAEAVARGEFERGVVLGGSGNGEAITAPPIATIQPKIPTVFSVSFIVVQFGLTIQS